METVIEHFTAERVIPIANFDDPEKAIPLAHALLAGGCRIIEVSFRSAKAAASVAAIASEIPEMFIGAGSLLTQDDVSTATAAGASFGIAPGYDPNVVKAAQEAVFPFIPGFLTPSNMSQALSFGCSVQKFFPAESAGPVMLQAALAAFTGRYDIKVVAAGGITPENAARWFAIPQVIAVGASWICPKELIEAQEWPEITRRAQALIAALSGAPAA